MKRWLTTLFTALIIVGVARGQSPFVANYPTQIPSSANLGNGANNAKSTLTSPLDAVTNPATVNVASATSFPNAPFPITIGSEILVCTSTFHAAFTCSRGQFGTTAAAHSSGASIANNVVWQYVDVIQKELIAIATETNTKPSANRARTTIVGTTAATMTNPRDVAVVGKIAFVTNFGANQINLYDVSVPSNPTLVSTITDADLNQPRQQAISGKYLYVSNQNANSYTVFDITNPKLPVKLITKTGGSIASPGGIYVRGNRLYLTGTQTGSQFTIFDNTNPAAPIELGSYTPPSGEKFGRCSFQSKYAYCPLQGNTPFTDDGLYIIDVSNAASPTLTGRFLINGIGTTGAPVDSSVNGNIVYALDEGGGFRIFNVTDPTTPTQLGYTTTGIEGGSTGMWAQGRYVYIAAQINNTVVAYDVIDPTNPVVVSTSAATLNVPSKLTVVGRYLYVVNRGSGTMSIVDLGQDDVAQLKAGALQSDHLAVSQGMRAGYGVIDGDFSIGRTMMVGDNFSVNGNASFNGSVTVGTWAATAIGTQYGGLGANNSASNGIPLFASGIVTMTGTSGTGNFVRVTNGTLVAPALGTPSSVTLTNATGLPIGGITGLGANVGTWLATPSSANLLAAMTDKTGTGLNVFGTGPTITNPIIAALANLTTNGILYTTGGNGTLNAATGVTTDGVSITTLDSESSTSGIKVGNAATLTWTGTSDSTGIYSGGNFISQTSAGANANLTGATPGSMIAVSGSMLHAGSGIITYGGVYNGRVRNTGTGSITTAYTFQSQNPSIAAGTTTTEFDDFVVLGGSVAGTITTRYGVKVNTLTSGTTRWGLWLQSDNAFIGGVLSAGSGPTTITDSAGKILTAALNTVGVAQGGTGQTSFTDGQLMIGNTATGLLSKATLTQGSGITITNGNGTITIAAAASSGATTALDNLASVNINSALLAQTGIDLGSTTKPFRNVFIFGAGTYGTTYFELTGTPTSTRVVTFPDVASYTVAQITNPQTFAGTQTFSGVIAAAAGSSGTPSINFGTANTGFYAGAGGFINATASATRVFDFNSSTFSIRSNIMLSFDGGTSGADAGIIRDGVAGLQVTNNTANQWGYLKTGVRDAGTATITNALIMGHQSTGTPAAGFGTRLQANANDSTTADVDAGGASWSWVTATHATHASQADIYTSTGGAASVSVATFSNAGTTLTGTNTNDSAAAGKIGEFVNSLIAVGSAVSLTTATPANVTSISLTAGDWDVQGNCNFNAVTATVTATQCGISTVSATLPNDGSEVYSGVQVTVLSEKDSVTLPRKRITVSATTTVFLVGQSTFSAGTVTEFGTINARRVR